MPPPLNDSALVDLDEPPSSSPSDGTAMPVEATPLSFGAVPPSPPSAPPSTIDSAGFVNLDEPLPPEPARHEQGVMVTLRGVSGVIAEFDSWRLGPLARLWTQILINRARWSGLDMSLLEVERMGRDDFLSLGLTESDLRKIADARLVEVSIPFETEKIGWEARIFPWEAMLSAATKSIRGNQSLYVVRHLARSTPESRPFADKSVLYMQSIPHGLRDHWNFGQEKKRVLGNLTSLPKPFVPIEAIDFSREELIDEILARCPGVIHVAGFDNWQGAVHLKLPYSPHRIDGIMLRDWKGDPDEVDSESVGELILELDPRPWLVSFNVYNSAARLGALAVAGGAGAAIGFQDTFDDELAEQFFAMLYKGLNAKGDLLKAFLSAQSIVREKSKQVVGSGMVLWREDSLKPEDVASIPVPTS